MYDCIAYLLLLSVARCMIVYAVYTFRNTNLKNESLLIHIRSYAT